MLKNYGTLWVGIVVMIAAVISVNVGINRSLNSGRVHDAVGRIESARLPRPKAAFERGGEERVSGDAIDGEAYGTLIAEDDKTQTAWNIQMEQILGSVQAQYTMEQSGLFDRARHSDEQFTQKMRWLNVRIREYERLALTGNDPEQAEQLQRLYMLRSSLQSVRDIVTP